MCSRIIWVLKPLVLQVVEKMFGNQNKNLLGIRKKMAGDERYSEDRELEQPLAAVQMGLIYVNPRRT